MPSSNLGLAQMRTESATLFYVRGGKVVRLVVYWERERALAALGLTRLSINPPGPPLREPPPW
jgi:hypothetical protein